MPENNVPGALGHNPLSTGPLGSNPTWWRDPARRLQFLVISLLFLLLSFPEIGFASGQSGGWQAPILLAGIAISYAGLIAQQWRVELGVAIIAVGLALSALSGGFAVLLGYPLVCWQVYVIRAHLPYRRRLWLAIAVVGSLAAITWQFIADRLYNPIFKEENSLESVLADPEMWLTIGLASLLALVSIALCWQFGKQSYARREEVANLAARAELATVSERNRIAREMHDIVAHSLTVVIAQADGGRYAGRKDPEKAIEALETISVRGREALTQMRSLLSVLHTEEGRDVAATPGISGIQDLISDANRSGAHATLAVEGEEVPLDETKGLTVYRVVQESLTNVIKHAGPVEVRVRLLWEDARLTVTVDNSPGEEQLTGSGRGLTGIKERVRIHGGKASWGSSALFPGGWNVTASIPLGA
ncbi:sensor histidine kinase [Corynebacterium urealyticum]|uniref:histidine kinase n=1 Tax=Corynebacterium urealyticum (strain ATCC 43042 / DSM 7109) TaxID=504474 RepID=B1VF84_CORU7|nr:sensor histidine kinase [Corynebacterium urealyticum]QQC42073.1 sensor histidine kinase [Corynebacterium urealyticum]QQE50696.1 sensor histidine kinase [Corynebacterium urealyticum]CAQ04423.1 two-component system sensor kinase [Corynebacterium urealyticum DSM 7109]SNV95428.1 two-component system sensor kinase [Corynebacterium urealyticum]